MTPQLLKKIMKCSWNGKDGNINHLSLVYSKDGISPFTMMDLNEDGVVLIMMSRINQQLFLGQCGGYKVATT